MSELTEDPKYKTAYQRGYNARKKWGAETIHQQQIQIRRLERALQFYATRENWQGFPHGSESRVKMDHGGLARAALQGD